MFKLHWLYDKGAAKNCSVYFPFMLPSDFVSKIVDFDDYSVHDDIFLTLITLHGGNILLGNVLLLPNKHSAWECLVCFDESAYVLTCNVRSFCFSYVEGPRCPNPHRMVGYI